MAATVAQGHREAVIRAARCVLPSNTEHTAFGVRQRDSVSVLILRYARPGSLLAANTANIHLWPVKKVMSGSFAF